MKAKTIRTVLKAKVKEWSDTITDLEVRKKVLEDTIITGGCIASMFLEEKVRDYDVYFKTKDTVYSIAKYYVDLFNKKNTTQKAWVDTRPGEPRVQIMIKSAGVAVENEEKEEVPGYQYFEQTDPEEGLSEEYIGELMKIARAKERGKDKYRPVFLSSNAITLTDKIQIVVRFFGDADEIHENFDFVHCKNYYLSGENKLVLNPDALECLLAKELRYDGSLYPLCSIVRTRKFIRRGWSIHAGQYLKMCMQLAELDLTDIHVLQEQMTGVDVAYFYEVLQMIKDKKDITASYVMEIVDRLM